MEHGEIEIAQRGFFGVAEAAALFDCSFAPSGQRDGQIVLQVQISALDSATEHDLGIIEERRTSFVQRLQALQEVGHLFDVPSDAHLIFLLLDRFFGVVGDGVHTSAHPPDEAVIVVGLGIGGHDGPNSGGVAPKGQDHDVHH